MISLALINSCPSVTKPVKLEGVLPFCTDTRNYKHPSAFVAIPGSRVNPLDVIETLLLKECPLVFFQEDSTNLDKVEQLKLTYPKTTFIPVSDSIIFLQELSHRHIQEWKTFNARNTVFAISGSNGKTTHKEMLSFLLNKVLPGKVVSTEKNNNNHLGVPLTLLGVSRDTEIVILELGSNHPGEIKVLCDIAEPDAGITTNIGATHLEFFQNEENVFEEEAYLYKAINNLTDGKGFYLINLDDEFLSKLKPTKGSVTFGEDSRAQARIVTVDSGVEIHFQGTNLLAQNVFVTGKHNKLNLITCLFIANHFYPEHKLGFIEACKEFRPTKNRSQWIELKERSIYLDAYNANPSSMKAALQGFRDSVLERGFELNEACIVLGDMNELGTSTPQYHIEVGRYVKELGFTNVYFIGQYSAHYLSGNPDGNQRITSADFKKEFLKECLIKFPIHFIKGSRSLQLESLLDIS